MNDINQEKMKVAASHSLHTRALYREKQSNNEISWCIASVATQRWADLLFENQEKNKAKLWDLIFDICLVNEENPCDAWMNKMKETTLICQKLNNLIFLNLIILLNFHDFY